MNVKNNVPQTASGKLKTALTAVATGATMAVTQVQAAIPTEAQDAFDEILADATALGAKAWVVAAGVVGITIAIGLFKKFIRRAAS